MYRKEIRMEQERYMVIDNQKGVVIPLQEDKAIVLEKYKETESLGDKDILLEEKVNKIQSLIKVLIRQSIRETIKEYNLQLTEELREYENHEIKRWQRMEENDAKRWDRLEKENERYWKELQKTENERWESIKKEEEKHWKQMEEHFANLDKNIRKKQMENKRKGAVVK